MSTPNEQRWQTNTKLNETKRNKEKPSQKEKLI